MTERVSRRNLSSSSGEERGVIQNVSMTSTACMITSRYKNHANVPMRLECGDRITDCMRFTYREVVDSVFRSLLTLTKSDVGRACGSDYVTYIPLRAQSRKPQAAALTSVPYTTSTVSFLEHAFSSARRCQAGKQKDIIG